MARSPQAGLRCASTSSAVLPSGCLTGSAAQRFVSDVCEGRAGRSSTRPFAQGTSGDITLPLPPMPEQQRIVEAIDSYLTRLDDAVASLERAQAKLKAYRASVLKAAVEGRLVPTEASLARAEKRDYEPADVLLARILKERRRRWEEAELARLKAAGKTPKDDKWKAKYEEPRLSEHERSLSLPRVVLGAPRSSYGRAAWAGSVRQSTTRDDTVRAVLTSRPTLRGTGLDIRRRQGRWTFTPHAFETVSSRGAATSCSTEASGVPI